MSRDCVTRISISIPPDLLKELDAVLKNIGYDRSRAIQLAIKNFLTDYNWSQQRGNVVGAILVLYDHTKRGIEESITDLQHEYGDLIRSSMHIHIDEENCLEIVAIKGDSKDVKRLMDAIMSIKGVKQVRLAIAST